MRIFIEDTFDSAHSLPHLPPPHKCRELHGHTYKIRLEFEGPIDSQTGFILDYDLAKSYWSAVKVRLDHRCLDPIIKPYSSCEHLSQFIASQWQLCTIEGVTAKLVRIELRETERCGVTLDL